MAEEGKVEHHHHYNGTERREVDAPVETVWSGKLKIVKQYGILGLAAITFHYWEPYVSQYLTKNETKVIKEQIQPLREELHNVVTMMINCKGGILAMKADDIIRITRNAATVKDQRVRDGLVRLLRRYTLENETKQRRFRGKVKELMKEIRKSYKRDLANMQHRALGSIGAYMDTHFPRKDYLDLIMDSLINTGCDAGDHVEMANDTYVYIVDLQDKFLAEMHKKMLASESRDVVREF